MYIKCGAKVKVGAYVHVDQQGIIIFLDKFKRIANVRFHNFYNNTYVDKLHFISELSTWCPINGWRESDREKKQIRINF